MVINICEIVELVRENDFAAPYTMRDPNLTQHIDYKKILMVNSVS